MKIIFFQPEKYQVQAFGTPAIYRLINLTENSSELEEATFTVHGIILEKELPPINHVECDSYSLIIFVPYLKYFRHNPRRNQNFAAYIRQYVALAGYDLESFNRTLEAYAKVHHYFRDLLPTITLEDIQPVSIGDFSALACYTRYFTSRRSCPSAIHQPFGPGVDPDGYLDKLRGNTYVHTEDNMVQFLGKTKTDSGLWYVICKRHLQLFSNLEFKLSQC